MTQHKLWDFVRPRTENEYSVWRVIEIKENELTAELRVNQLTRSVRRVTTSPDFFISLEKLTGGSN